MSDFAWISRAPWHPSNLRPLRHSYQEDESALRRCSEIRRRIEAGEPVDAAFLPPEIYGAPDATEQDYKLPDIFFAAQFMAVSRAAADVMRQFDLGQASFAPVKVLKKDRSTPVPGEWLWIAYGNKKNTVVPEESRNVTVFVRDILSGRARLEDHDLALSSDASKGPSLWVEEKFDSAFFMSAALGTALKKAKAHRGFFLYKCRII